jgi:hypothetical protein
MAPPALSFSLVAESSHGRVPWEHADALLSSMAGARAPLLPMAPPPCSFPSASAPSLLHFFPCVQGALGPVPSNSNQVFFLPCCPRRAANRELSSISPHGRTQQQARRRPWRGASALPPAAPPSSTSDRPPARFSPATSIDAPVFFFALQQGAFLPCAL